MQLHLSINPKEQQICPLADDHTLPDQYDLPETDISTKYTVKSTRLRSYNTRGKSNFYLPRVRRIDGKQRLLYQGLGE